MNKLFSIERKKNGSIIWSQDQIDYIISNYNIDYSTGKLAQEFRTSPDSIRRLLRENGVKVLTLSELGKRKFPRNSNYFQSINSIDKAYWLGFLYADGYISRNEIRINLQRGDEEHLTNFYQIIEAINHTVKYSEKRTPNKTYYQAYAHIRDNQMVADLAKLGCVNNKSLILSFPNESQVPQEFISHFIRGYFDGDGTIQYKKRNNSSFHEYRIGFCGTQDMMENIKTFLGKENLALRKDKKLYSFYICGNKQLERILPLLYKNSRPNIELERKRIIYNQFLLERFGGEPINIGCE